MGTRPSFAMGVGPSSRGSGQFHDRWPHRSSAMSPSALIISDARADGGLVQLDRSTTVPTPAAPWSYSRSWSAALLDGADDVRAVRAGPGQGVASFAVGPVPPRRVACITGGDADGGSSRRRRPPRARARHAGARPRSGDPPATTRSGDSGPGSVRPGGRGQARRPRPPPRARTVRLRAGRVPDGRVGGLRRAHRETVGRGPGSGLTLGVPHGPSAPQLLQQAQHLELSRESRRAGDRTPKDSNSTSRYPWPTPTISRPSERTSRDARSSATLNGGVQQRPAGGRRSQVACRRSRRSTGPGAARAAGTSRGAVRKCWPATNDTESSVARGSGEADRPGGGRGPSHPHPPSRH